MADVQVNVKIEAAEAAKTVQELKKSLKDLINAQSEVTEGTDEWKKLAAAINDTEGRIGDLNDSFNTLRGSGIERTNASIGLLREGIFNLDPGKLTLGFKGLGSALLAVGKTILTNPLFLIVGVIVGIGAAIFSLKDKFQFMRELFEGITKVIDAVIGTLKEWSDAILGTTFIAEESAQRQIDAYKAVADTVKERYERELALAAAYGKDTLKIEEEKSRAIIKSIDNQINALVKLGQIQGFLTEEQEKQIVELGKERKKEELALEVSRAKQYKGLVDSIQKEQEERKKASEARIKAQKEEAKNKEANEIMLANLEYEAWKQAHEKEKAEKEAAEKEELARKEKLAKDIAEIELYWANWAKAENEKIAAEVEARLQREAELDKQRLEEAAYKQIEVARGVADVFTQLEENKFTAERNRIEKALQNESLSAEQKYALELELFNKERELRKRNFQITKAFNVAAAIQDGIRSVLGALAQTATLGPGSIALAATNGAIAAANIAKILATKFDEGVAPAPPKLSVSTSVPSQQNQQLGGQTALQIQDGTFIRQEDQRVYVLESDITKAQSRVTRVEEQAKF